MSDLPPTPPGPPPGRPPGPPPPGPPPVRPPAGSAAGAPTEPSTPGPPPTGPRAPGRRQRVLVLIGAAVVVVVGVGVVAVLASGGSDDESADVDTEDVFVDEPADVTDESAGATSGTGPWCDALEGVVGAPDVEATLGETVGERHTDLNTDTCDFTDVDGGLIVSVGLERDDAAGFEITREVYAEDGALENVDGLGDDAFFEGSEPQDVFARSGDIVIDLTYFGDADNSIRDPLIQLAQLVLGRVPPDIQLPTE